MANSVDEFYLNDQETEGDNVISYIMQTYVPFWPWFLIMVTLCLSAAHFYLRYSTPTYEVNAKILVKDEKKGVDASKVLDALNVFGESKIVENEIEMCYKS